MPASEMDASMAEQHIDYFQVKEGEFPISALLQRIGEDYLLSVWGGSAHIGAVAMAQPRPSLQDPERVSATTSVFCYVGHKEDELVKKMAEKLAATLGGKVVVAAGLHWDGITLEGIRQVDRNVDALIELIVGAKSPETQRKE
jgi:hypothetical protein